MTDKDALRAAFAAELSRLLSDHPSVTRHDIAAAAGVSVQSVGKWINRESSPASRGKIEAIEELLGVSGPLVEAAGFIDQTDWRRCGGRPAGSCSKVESSAVVTVTAGSYRPPPCLGDGTRGGSYARETTSRCGGRGFEALEVSGNATVTGSPRSTWTRGCHVGNGAASRGVAGGRVYSAHGGYHVTSHHKHR